MSIFISLIIVLDRVNDVYTIYDLGIHDRVRKELFKRHKLKIIIQFVKYNSYKVQNYGF